VNENVNSILYFLFFAHLLEVKGPIFLFGCDGSSETGDVDGYDNYYYAGKTDAKHLFYDSFDEDKIRSLLAAETKGANENWPVFEQWFERRNIRRIPIYNVGGAGHVNAFEIIAPGEIPERVARCDRDFDPGQRTMTTGEHRDHATLETNIAQYDYFCSQYPSSEITRRIIPYLIDSTKVVQQSRDQTLDALNMVLKLLMRLDNK
jgi:hypothetical protein